MSAYNKHPSIHIENSDGKVFSGDDEILRCLQAELSGDRWTLIVETYPGISEERICRMLEELRPDLIISARDILREPEALKVRLDCILTQDRVFGRMYSGILLFMGMSALMYAFLEIAERLLCRWRYGSIAKTPT